MDDETAAPWRDAKRSDGTDSDPAGDALREAEGRCSDASGPEGEPAGDPLALADTVSLEGEEAAPSPAAESSPPRRAALPADSDTEISFRFPYSHVALELVPDLGGAFRVRLNWHRGKTVLTQFETSALRPLAEVTLGGQRFPIFLTRHARRRRDLVFLAGRRKTGRSARGLLRFAVSVGGREDRLTWTWRIAATAAAWEQVQRTASDAPDRLRLYLPFAPGNARVVRLADTEAGLAVWMNEVAVTLVPLSAGFTLSVAERSIDLSLEGIDLAGEGVTVAWEMWAQAARTEAEARDALLAHLTQSGDRRQRIESPREPFLLALGARAEAALMDESRIEKRSAERHFFRPQPGDARRTIVGEGGDAALAACALLTRYALSGDDALRRRARLIGYGVTDFQIAQSESAHWGALWDLQRDRKHFEDPCGEKTLSVAATGRAVRGLYLLHAHFEQDLLARAATAAAEWLMLRTDRRGFPQAERFQEKGPPVPEGSLWVVGETIGPLVQTFRASGNEMFLKVALRGIDSLREEIAEGRLRLDEAPTELLAACIEGVLLASREYENAELIAFARRLGAVLRTRRHPDGTVPEPCRAPTTPLAPTLAAVRAALALARVEEDPAWVILALRGLRTAWRQASDEVRALPVSELGALCALPTGLLLTVAARARGCSADLDQGRLTRSWQVFAPDPATRDYIQVTDLAGGPVDYLALVCPLNLQVLVAVLAPPEVREVRVTKNQRQPFLKNLLVGDVDLRTPLEPLGDGAEARIGVFLADT